jgi:D-glycero-alpha-D-manno-heptose-7-phosphate kinase
MIISKTPLRISLIGGGTDINDFYKNNLGQVISTSIDKYIYIIVKERFDNQIVLHYTDNEIVEDVNEIRHELIREALKIVGITKGIEIITLADIPSKGTGLGSSSSLTVGLLNALYTYVGNPVTQEKLAMDACKIEIDILKKPIGKQDQYIAAYGGLRKFTFLADETVKIKKFNLTGNERRKLGSNIILYYTNITRDANLILADQKRNIPLKNKELLFMSDLVPILENAIEQFRFEEVGNVLRKSWEVKKLLTENITNEIIDNMVNTALGSGATGCKIAGAGGGGFLLSFVPREKQDNFRKSMSEYKELPFMLDPFGTRIIFNIRFDSNNVN